MIDVQGLTKRFGGHVAVQELTFRVERGEVFGFLGPNGAGKTTTIRMLMGILVPSAGRALVDGLDCQDERVEVKRRVGYLPDAPIFYDYLRGREILEFVGEMHGLPRAAARARSDALLGELGLADDAEEFAANYSMGMKKKLGLACALIHEPAVLILDEPTNGLDPRAAREVRDRLLAAAAQGVTVFLSTHLLDMAQRTCTRVGIVHRGELVGLGGVDELRERLVEGGSLEEVFLAVTAEPDGEPVPGDGERDRLDGARGPAAPRAPGGSMAPGGPHAPGVPHAPGGPRAPGGSHAPGGSRAADGADGPGGAA